MNALLLLSAIACLECGPVKPQFDITTATIEVVWYESELEIVKTLGLTRPVNAVSECYWYPESNTSHCIIHTVRPMNTNDVYTRRLGHELLHAFWGFYHDQEEVRRTR